jgi:hypothetical protein
MINQSLPERNPPVCRFDETAREALGRFLRERRERISPAQAGITSRRGRRTPGLRREEVAFLADIGVKWYARLEAGDEIHPSHATLTGIAVALQLSNVELEYMLELAGLLRPNAFSADIDLTVPKPVSSFLEGLRGIAATVGDRILTPLQWNGLSDALYDHSRHRLPVQRNALVRSLVDTDFITFLGDDREELVYRAVGMFRLNYASERPSPLAGAVYEAIKDEPLFNRAWNRRIVAAELTDEHVSTRQHPVVGSLSLYATDFSIASRPDLFLRTFCPANAESAEKFEHLEALAAAR